MNQAEALYQLQEIDLKLIRIQKRLQEIGAVLGDSQALIQAQRDVQMAQERLTPLQKKARSLELEIESNSAKIHTTDEQLYSGRVSNPKELQDMQQEIQTLKKRNVELEDQLLETMLAVEEAEAALNDANARLREAQAGWENEHQHLLAEKAELEEQTVTLTEKRQQAVKPVAAENLKLYDNLKVKKHNQPVAVLAGTSCSVCGVEQTLAISKSVRQEQGLVYCTSCGRILVAR